MGDSVYPDLVTLATQLARTPEDDTKRKTTPADGDSKQIWPLEKGLL